MAGGKMAASKMAAGGSENINEGHQREGGDQTAWRESGAQSV